MEIDRATLRKMEFEHAAMEDALLVASNRAVLQEERAVRAEALVAKLVPESARARWQGFRYGVCSGLGVSLGILFLAAAFFSR